MMNSGTEENDDECTTVDEDVLTAERLLDQAVDFLDIDQELLIQQDEKNKETVYTYEEYLKMNGLVGRDHDKSMDDGTFLGVFQNYNEQNMFIKKKHKGGRMANHVFVQNCRLFCLTCMKYDSVRHLAETYKNHRGSDEKTFLMKGLGDLREKRSLHVKLTNHYDSNRHADCAWVLNQAEKGLLPSLLEKVEEATKKSRRVIVTTRIFNVAYQVVKDSLPLSEFRRIIDLHIINNTDMGTQLFSDKACVGIIKFISQRMKDKIAAMIRHGNCDFSIMADEGTSVDKKTTLTIDLKADVFGDGEPMTVFWNLIELQDASGDTIGRTVFDELAKSLGGEAFLKKHFICLAVDGASAMTGTNKGAAGYLIGKVGDHLKVNHCLAHRLISLKYLLTLII